MAIPVLPILIAAAGGAAFLRETEVGRRVSRAAKEAFNAASAALNEGGHGGAQRIAVGQGRSGNRAHGGNGRQAANMAATMAINAMAMVVLFPELERGRVKNAEARRALGMIRRCGYASARDVEDSLVSALGALAKEMRSDEHEVLSWTFTAVRRQHAFQLCATCNEVNFRLLSRKIRLDSPESLRRADAVLSLEDGEAYAEAPIPLGRW